MPRVPLHLLSRSHDQGEYVLYRQDRLVRHIQPGDEASFQDWLREVASFAFHGASGSLNVYLEARSPKGHYWYGYHTSQGRTRKRYLGRTETLSLARLEEAAQMLLPTQAIPAPSPELAAFSSKLAPPRLPTAFVERERLLTLLNGALATPLTLLSAAAGWGKTTLLATWTRRQTTAQIAWLSLDELDKSATRFWVSLIAALRRCPALASGFGETVVARLQSPQPLPLSSWLFPLLHELESAPAVPIILILDDYQVVADPAIDQDLAFFVEHLPAHVHLILACRIDPDLPLARWRARGHLTEIRADALRFREDEAKHYLDQMLTPPLSAQESRQLVNHTDGWIVSLQLAALTIQTREDRTAFLQQFTGSQHALVDYVQEEILACLPTPVRDFVLQCAILSRLDPAICQAVTAAPTQAASQQILAFLERANLFLLPQDDMRCSYHLHDLFRSTLLTILHTTQPELEPVLHQRAARFYAAQGQWAAAITHALAAADYTLTVRLLEQTVEQFWLKGEAATLTNWVLALPDAVVYEHARLLLTTALYLLNTVMQTTRDMRAKINQQVRHLMLRVETALLVETSHPIPATGTGKRACVAARAAEEALLRRRLRLLQLSLAVGEAAATGAYERLTVIQQEIEETPTRDEEAIWQMVPLWASFLLHHTARRAGAHLLPHLLEAKERVNRSASRYARIKVRQYLALAALEAGRLRLAYEESLAALDLIEQANGYELLKGYFESVLARVLYQWNRLEEAHSLLQTLLREALARQQLDLIGRGYAEQMQVALIRGDWPLAHHALLELEQWVRREHFGIYPGWLPALRTHWWLAHGQMKEASDWATGVVFTMGAWERNAYDAFPVVMRVYFAQQRWGEAVALLTKFSNQLDRPTNRASTLTYLAQSLVALHQANLHEQACAIAARLLAATESEGYMRVYLDEGQPMRQALMALLASPAWQHELAPSTLMYLAKLLTAFEEEQHRANGVPRAATMPEPLLTRQAAHPAFAPLTRREQEVLRLLAAGASNQTIAQTLVIELSTVKKHVSNLLGKLGATSRTQAISYAHALSLL